MSFGRPVLCSTGAGAADCVPDGWRYEAGNVNELTIGLDEFRVSEDLKELEENRKLMLPYTWNKIRARYQSLWRSLLS